MSATTETAEEIYRRHKREGRVSAVYEEYRAAVLGQADTDGTCPSCGHNDDEHVHYCSGTPNPDPAVGTAQMSCPCEEVRP